MKMKGAVIAAAASTIPLLLIKVPSVSAVDYLEPNVQRHVGVLPLDICNELIYLGEKGRSMQFICLVTHWSV